MADWSSIWAGFGIAWGSLALYGLIVLMRLRRFRDLGRTRDATGEQW